MARSYRTTNNNKTLYTGEVWEKAARRNKFQILYTPYPRAESLRSKYSHSASPEIENFLVNLMFIGPYIIVITEE